MEIKVFAALGYCLAIPIPYRFLRRFAKVRTTGYFLCSQNISLRPSLRLRFLLSEEGCLVLAH